MNALKAKRFMSLLMRYKPEELPDIVGEIFPGIDWNGIKDTCIRMHLNMCKMRELANAIIHTFKEVKPPLEDVQYALWYLQFFDSFLHKYLHWCGAILTNKESEFPNDFEELNQKLRQVYRMQARKVEVIMKLEEDIVFIMLVEKIITKRGMKNGQPFFAAFNISIDKQYVFFSPKIQDSSEQNHLMLLAQALGYGNYKQISFSGLDVRSMFGMIKNCTKNENRQLATFSPIKFRVEDNVTDFTQGRERMNYAVNVLPPGLTNLKEFTVHSRNEFRGSRLAIPPSVKIESELIIKIRSKDKSIEDVFRELIACGLMKDPIPEYVSKFPSLDRNSIKIRSSKDEYSQNPEQDLGTSDDDEMF